MSYKKMKLAEAMKLWQLGYAVECMADEHAVSIKVQ